VYLYPSQGRKAIIIQNPFDPLEKTTFLDLPLPSTGEPFDILRAVSPSNHHSHPDLSSFKEEGNKGDALYVRVWKAS
jgi:hypothetical protein